jgi:hypothetical protein
MGVSAFAFQGTNAHVLVTLRQPSGVSHDVVGARLPASWQRQRFWFLPLPNLLLARVDPWTSPGELLYSLQLTHPGVVFLWDHQVGLAY